MNMFLASISRCSPSGIKIYQQFRSPSGKKELTIKVKADSSNMSKHVKSFWKCLTRGKKPTMRAEAAHGTYKPVKSFWKCLTRES